MRAAVLAAAAACNHIPLATAPAAGEATALPTHPFAVPDELMEFRASLRGITLGVVQTAVGRPGYVGDRRAIIVRSRGRTDGVASLFGEIRWELDTTIDLDAGFPLTDHEEAWVDLAGEQEHHEESYAGNSQHDPHSFAGVVRGWHSEPGQHTEARVGVGGGHFPVTLEHAGRELLAAQGKPAVRYEGKARGEVPFTIWVSDDAARVPLAFRAESPIGTIAVDLVDYHVESD